MKAPMLQRSINSQFRKAMKRRRERAEAMHLRMVRRLKHRIMPIQLPETPESIADFYSRWYRRYEI